MPLEVGLDSILDGGEGYEHRLVPALALHAVPGLQPVQDGHRVPEDHYCQDKVHGKFSLGLQPMQVTPASPRLFPASTGPPQLELVLQFLGERRYLVTKQVGETPFMTDMVPVK